VRNKYTDGCMYIYKCYDTGNSLQGHALDDTEESLCNKALEWEGDTPSSEPIRLIKYDA